MYQEYFNFQYPPFSIAPDPRFLFMSAQHKEALAHLIYGIQSSGAFVVLSGEVGSGKTTVCRCFLDQVPENVDIAFILNPKLSAEELLASICDELSISYQGLDSSKKLIDAINIFLLENHSQGRNTVVIIEEAQNLSEDVLEQLRLLTNLETNEKKLLQIVLLAQPEFLKILQKHEMRQLEQRITARFHLDALTKNETLNYIHHRLSVAGAKQDPFPDAIKKAIFKASFGIPRLINLIADRCLLGAYANNKQVVTKTILHQALKELKGETSYNNKFLSEILFKKGFIISLGILLLSLMLMVYFLQDNRKSSLFSNVWLNNVDVKTSENSMQPTINKQVENISLMDVEQRSFSFSEIIDLYAEEGLSAQGGFSEAVSVLAELWRIEYQETMRVNGPQSLCVYAATQGLECFYERGNIGFLLKLGRPAILKFTRSDGRYYYGVLIGVDDDKLLIRFSEQVVHLGFHELEKIWLGEFFMLAKMPEAWRGKILQEGDDNALSLWINNALFEIFNAKDLRDRFSRTRSSVYGQAEVVQLKRLQTRAGINADGKVGVNTIIFINSLIDPSVPRLLGVFEDSEILK